MYLQKLPEYQEKVAPSAKDDTKEKLELNENENEAFIQGSDERSIKSVIFDTSNGILKYMFCVWFTFLVTLGKLLYICEYYKYWINSSHQTPNNKLMKASHRF